MFSAIIIAHGNTITMYWQRNIKSNLETLDSHPYIGHWRVMIADQESVVGRI